MTSVLRTREGRAGWEHAVLRVVPTATGDGWSFAAIAWVGEHEIYNRTLTTMYWSAPLADLGAEGWELVTASVDTGVLGRWDLPRSADFFLKRPTG